MEPQTPITGRDDLVHEYREYAHTIARHLIGSMRLPADLFDEYVAAGYLGLVEAAERFDFNSGREFKSFAFLRIRGAIIDSIRETSDLAGKAYRYAKAFQAANSYREEVEISAKDWRPNDATLTPADRLSQVLDYAAKGLLAYRVALLDAEVEITEQAEECNDPETNLSHRQILKKLGAVLETLPPKERLIIEEHYFRERSFAQIAAENEGLSKSWVSRLHARALESLRAKLMAGEVT